MSARTCDRAAEIVRGRHGLRVCPTAKEPATALSAIPGQFLIKDFALLGISLWALGDAWKASERKSV